MSKNPKARVSTIGLHHKSRKWGYSPDDENVRSSQHHQHHWSINLNTNSQHTHDNHIHKHDNWGNKNRNSQHKHDWGGNTTNTRSHENEKYIPGRRGSRDSVGSEEEADLI